MRRKVHFIHLEKDFLSHSIEVDEFDTLIAEDYDDICIITPRARYVASLDEWIDYGYIDLDDDVDIRVLQRSYMGRV